MRLATQPRLLLGLLTITGCLLGMSGTAAAQDLYIKNFQVGVTGSTVTYQAPNGRDISVEVVAVEPFTP